MVMTLSNPIISSAIGLFRSGITSPERLRNTTVGRQWLLDELLEKIERRISKSSGQNLLLIGPRGIGKTHLLSLLEEHVTTSEKLSPHYIVIRFPEENHRMLSFADFLLGIVEVLSGAEGSEIERDGDWGKLYDEICTEEDNQVIADRVLPRLKRYCKNRKTTLLIMLENIDVLVTQQFKKERDIHLLRSFFMDNAHVMLVGTSPIYFPGLNDVKHPLFDFFDIQTIDELTQEETIELIRRNLVCDQRQEVLDDFDKLIPKIQALHEMTGGNPRLTTMLYGLIAKDYLGEVQTQFQQMLDRISPFYQDRIKDLPPQERAVLETMALMRETPRTPANIAKRMRLSAQQTSSLLKRMSKSGYLVISDNPNDKRSKLYRIKEGFFDIWLAMSESRVQRKHLPYLVDFFSRWYADKQEREEKRQALWQQLESNTSEYDASPGSNKNMAVKENAHGILGYLAEAENGAEKQQTKLELAVGSLRLGDPGKAKQVLADLDLSMGKNSTGHLFTWMHDQSRQWLDGNVETDVRQQIEQMIDYWRCQRSGQLEKAARVAEELSLDFTTQGLHLLNIALLEDLLVNTSEAEQISIRERIAWSQFIADLLDAALKSYNEILRMVRESGDRTMEGRSLNNISQIYHARGDYEKALSCLDQSLLIRREVGDRFGEGETLNNISMIYHVRGDYDTALSYLDQSLVIRREVCDRSGEGRTINNISQVYYARDDYDTALNYLKKSLAIQQNIDDAVGLCATLFNIGHIHLQNNENNEALSAWVKVYSLAKVMGFAKALSELKELAEQLGFEDGLTAWEALANQEKTLDEQKKS